MRLLWTFVLWSQACCCCAALKHASSIPAATAAAARSQQASQPAGVPISRQTLVSAAVQAAAAGTAMVACLSKAAPAAAAVAATAKAPTATAAAYMDVRMMEPLTEANGYSSASAPTGKLVLELFGTEAPKTVEAFLSYVAPEPVKLQQDGDEAGEAESGPSYASSLFTRLVPGRQLDGGRISGLNQISLAGSSQLQYYGRIFPSTPSFESNALRHDRRGLLTKSKLEAGPEFTITLGPCPELDASNVVFGRVIEGEETLRALEQVPLYSSGSTQEEGSVADNWYRAQRSASLFVGRNVLRDERAVDRTGTFLRRVDVVRCGRLNMK
eukprot:TRINITY_DN1288_c0_g1_i1.p2 TRINITY_DN1288_c0_g1~~TRINITY_DN1288_c0_g1_i1.p2  ORF type:complete len:327 (-),score=85.67 TRINITY_DN1288_c0_g1_i1:627-1607(-)